MKDLVGIDAHISQRIVLSLRHGKHESVSDHGTLHAVEGNFAKCLRQVSVMRCFRSALESWEGAVFSPVLIDSDAVVQKSAGVNLSKGFLRCIVGKVFELLADLLIHVGSLAERNFPTGGFVKIFQVETASGRGLVGKDLSVFHVRDSRR